MRSTIAQEISVRELARADQAAGPFVTDAVIRVLHQLPQEASEREGTVAMESASRSCNEQITE